jgi:hypothetical protein
MSMARRLGWGTCLAVILVSAGWFVSPLRAAADPPEPAPAAHAPNSLCLICHGQAGLTSTGEDGRERTIHAVEAKAFADSAHGALACVKCHPGQSRLPHPDHQAAGLTEPADTVACAKCHEDASEAYMKSAHGTMVELGDARAPACADCHGNVHSIRPVDQWPDSVRAQACGECHQGATASFTNALRHEPPSPNSLAASYFAGRFLMILTAAVLAFGIIHVELQLLRWLAQRRGGVFRRPRTHGD